ncbi:amino acid/amide ABC transporter substrate-binding protein (HAAT family) [Actinocorallia herbida]|uniref:Amino acid/amide ABC transporter substrate-binding protein (HAAT family) n=1 Tax=Actinocorallia herbida TaxID=58109 RepID=A0A3N1CWG2_9ACTN|nr:ABC transporter substrate-binding protein [Actinocorallia herbida]ROO85623.1 amino acid/amide ABC transporter substrate-binding protein (HAAT family) [Actinocorallia herbida]
MPTPRSTSLRRLIAPVLAVTTALALTACGSADSGVSEADAKSQAADLVQILGIDGDLGADVQFKLGAALTLSGASAANGASMQNAIELAIEQIKAAGGPALQLSVKDIKGPDPVAAKQAASELAAEGVPAKITSMGDGLGSMLADTDKDKILSLDGVGGAQVFTQGTEYFYGTREVAPSDAVPGALEWFKQAHPEGKTVGLVGVDLGPLNQAIQADVKAKIEAAGLTFNGLWETVAPTSQDYASVIAKVEKNEPDLLWVAFGGAAPGAFAAQAKTAGIGSELLGIEFTDEATKASKGAFDSDGFKFAMDYFDAATPANPLAKLFVDAYRKAYDAEPDFYAANAYEETLMVWDLIRRVTAAGGDATDSAQLKAALEKDPKFASVYGGDDATVGALEIDLKTHGVAHRPMGVFEYKAGKVTPLATYDVGAKDFRLAE